MKFQNLYTAITAVGALTLAATSFNALAQKTQSQDLETRFVAADNDNDGKLTLEEAKAGMPRVAKGFSRIDKDKKGYITLEQLKAAMSSRGK